MVITHTNILHTSQKQFEKMVKTSRKFTSQYNILNLNTENISYIGIPQISKNKQIMIIFAKHYTILVRYTKSQEGKKITNLL